MKIRKMNEMNTPKYGIIRTDYKPKEKFDKRVYFLWLDDLEALYVDGKLIQTEPSFDPIELLKLAEEYNFTYSDVYIEYAYEENDSEYWDDRLRKAGYLNNSFPENIENFPMYNRWLKKNHPDRYEAKKFKF